jgi:hypothetical protein
VVICVPEEVIDATILEILKGNVAIEDDCCDHFLNTCEICWGIFFSRLAEIVANKMPEPKGEFSLC